MRSRKVSPRPEVALGDRDDEAQVGLDHVGLGHHVAALDALGQLDLLLCGQQRHAPDRAQVEPQRVEAGLDGEVDLGLLGRLDAGLRAASAAASTLCASLVASRPSAPTTSMPCSSRCWWSSWICSLVTSTSSKVEAICSKVRNPRSWPSTISWRRSSSSQIGASSASRTSVLVLTPPASLDDTQPSERPDPRNPAPQSLSLRSGRRPMTGSRTQVVSDSTRSARYLGTVSLP